jgi:dTMP kinase
VIVLDVPAEEAARRRASRGRAAEIFERSEVQRRCAEVYARLGEAYPGDSIVHVDGSMGVGEVHEAILEAVQRMLARKGQEGIPA